MYSTWAWKAIGETSRLKPEIQPGREHDAWLNSLSFWHNKRSIWSWSWRHVRINLRTLSQGLGVHWTANPCNMVNRDFAICIQRENCNSTKSCTALHCRNGFNKGQIKIKVVRSRCGHVAFTPNTPADNFVSKFSDMCRWWVALALISTNHTVRDVRVGFELLMTARCSAGIDPQGQNRS